jgi:undecaprenyl-diphosphatase
MTLLQAIVLGIVQGLTEFLPVSSIAHMRLVSVFCGWKDPGAAFSAIVQLVAYIAVLLYFRREYIEVARAMLVGAIHVGAVSNRDPVVSRTRSEKLSRMESTPTNQERKLGWMIIIATIPIVVLGLLFHKHIEHNLRRLDVIACALIGLALLLALAEWTEHRRNQRREPLRDLHQLGWRDAIVVGCFQAFALIPGASRSGSTITGGLFLGMKRDTAARFSFLISLPAVFAAGVFQLRKAHLWSSVDALSIIVGSVVALIVGYGAIAFLLGYLRRHTTWPFIVYRLLLGNIVLTLTMLGKLSVF